MSGWPRLPIETASDGMTNEERDRERKIYDLAEAQAESCAPSPANTFNLAARDSFIAIASVFAFCLFAGVNLKSDDMDLWLSAIPVSIGLIHYGVFKYKEQKHSKAFAEAYTRLRALGEKRTA